MTQSVITAGDASTGLVQSAGNDGTLVLQVGAAGAKVNALSFDAAGNPTLLKQPVLPAQSMVRLNTANGFGSTNTVIRRFTNVVTNQGSDITYADSATLGTTFTINTNGVYAITYGDSFNTIQDYAISLNSSQLTTSGGLIATSDRLAIATVSGANISSQISGTFYLVAGSVIRPHANISPTGAALDRTNFTITRVA